MNPLLTARNIRLGNRRRPRLRDIDLALVPGDRLALLGVNGAGKSSLLQVLAGVLAPDAGVVLLHGRPLASAPASVRRHIGFLPQRVPAYAELTVLENLRWAARLRGLRGRPLGTAVDRACTRLQLDDLRDRLAARLSAGQLQRLGLAQAVVHEPDILILDEPTAGLDPLQTDQLRDLLAGLADARCLVLATHLLEDAQRLCNRVALLHDGAIGETLPVSGDTDLLERFRAHAAAASPTTAA